MNILFYDPCCPKPYDTTTLKNEPMGGTEATVIRIATKFAEDGHTVRVCQHNAIENRYEPNTLDLCFLPIEECADFKPDVIILLRQMQFLKELREMYGPKPKFYVWMHDVLIPEQAKWGPHLDECDATVVGVSRWHQQQIHEAFRQEGYRPWALKYIYNPIDDNLNPQFNTPDPHKLVYFSSPHKGLDQTLEVVKHLRQYVDKSFKLHVANPGYLSLPNLDDAVSRGDVEVLGPLTHKQVIDEVRSALCVLHVNLVFPETFGLVHAEANAVGTPFLAHSLGATPELADHPQEILDCRNGDKILERLKDWSEGRRPRVFANPAFRLSSVATEWYYLFSGLR